MLSCAPVWEHPDTKKLQDKGMSLTEIADVIPWRDHWMQAIYYLPTETSVIANKEISLLGYHDEYSMWFQLISETMYNSLNVIYSIFLFSYRLFDTVLYLQK